MMDIHKLIHTIRNVTYHTNGVSQMYIYYVTSTPECWLRIEGDAVQ